MAIDAMEKRNPLEGFKITDYTTQITIGVVLGILFTLVTTPGGKPNGSDIILNALLFGAGAVIFKILVVSWIENYNECKANPVCRNLASSFGIKL